MNAPVKTLLFDFGGTLDADGVAWKERFHALYRAAGLDVTSDAFAPAFYAADDQLVGGLPPKTDLSGTVHALTVNLESELARRCAESKSESGGDRSRRIASGFMSECVATFERNQPVLQALSERYQLGIVSNFYGNLEAVCESAGLCSFFKVMVDSHCVGAEKPDPVIFVRRSKGSARRRKKPSSSAIRCAATGKAPGAWACASSGSRLRTSRQGKAIGRRSPR